MNVIIVDTSVWISFFAGKTYKEIELALEEGRVYIPPIVVSELLSVKLGKKEKKELTEFLKELPLVNSDFEHWTRVGELRAILIGKGITISTPDAHVAQCAIDLDGFLATEDKIFELVSKKVDLKLV